MVRSLLDGKRQKKKPSKKVRAGIPAAKSAMARRINVYGDGHCLYRSLARAILPHLQLLPTENGRLVAQTPRAEEQECIGRLRRLVAHLYAANANQPLVKFRVAEGDEIVLNCNPALKGYFSLSPLSLSLSEKKKIDENAGL